MALARTVASPEIPRSAEAPMPSRATLVWRRFRRHRMAVAGGIVLLILVGVSILAPFLTPYPPDQINLLNASLPPSPQHLLGTDELGRDIFTRLLYGGRVSLLIGAFTMMVASVVGTFYGLVSGYFGGWVDAVLMRFVELLLSFPAIFLLLILISFVGGHASLLLMVLYLGLFGWMGLARLVRSEVLRVRSLEYVEAARTLGMGHLRLLLRHILPNVMAPVWVSATFSAAGAMLSEAALDYLGFGLPPGVASWGNMLADANTTVLTQPMAAVIPGAVITLAVVSLNFIGDALRDALDPRHTLPQRRA
jgi:peptide/nickel transport system permease protein